MSDLLIRPAQPSDKADVMEISKTVWDGHDYLPQVWDAWISESQEQGFLLVAEQDDRVVGIQHTAIQPGPVAWMEGIRVHPDYRQRGIAGRMLDAAIDKLPELGIQTARLSTAHINEASSRAALSRGFREVDRFNIYSAEPEDAPDLNVLQQPVTAGTIQELRLAHQVDSSMMIHQWSAYELPQQRSPEEFPYHLVYPMNGRIEAIGIAGESRDGTQLSLIVLEGTPEGMAGIARGMRSVAARLGKQRIVGMLPRRAVVDEAVQSAGFVLDDHLYVVVFEMNLRSSTA